MLKIKEIVHLQMLLIMHKYLLDELPIAIRQLIRPAAEVGYETRRSNHFANHFSTNNYRLFAFACLAPKLWNDIISTTFTLNEVPQSKFALKRYLKSYFINRY